MRGKDCSVVYEKQFGDIPREVICECIVPRLCGIHDARALELSGALGKEAALAHAPGQSEACETWLRHDRVVGRPSLTLTAALCCGPWWRSSPFNPKSRPAAIVSKIKFDITSCNRFEKMKNTIPASCACTFLQTLSKEAYHPAFEIKSWRDLTDAGKALMIALHVGRIHDIAIPVITQSRSYPPLPVFHARCLQNARRVQMLVH